MSAAGARVGRVLGGRYRIDALIGQGGFGVVYRATHLELLRPVAIKALLRPGGAEDTVLARFQREARLQAGLRHPAIVRLLDFAREPDGLVYMVQEFVEGRTLHEHLESVGRMPLRRAVRIVDDLLDGLAAAHEEGIVHRDLKPANIMLVQRGDREEVRILDFGLAKIRASEGGGHTITRMGQLLGTPAFMAPEQIEQRDVSAATDLYATGVLLYLLLTGTRPFNGSMKAVLTAHLMKPPPELPPDVPRSLAGVVRRAMAKEPASRYRSAAEMQAALRAALVYPQPAVAPAEGPHTVTRPEPSSVRDTLITPGWSSHWQGAIGDSAELRDAIDAASPDGSRAPAMAATPSRRHRMASWITLGLVVSIVGGALLATSPRPGSPGEGPGEGPSAERPGLKVAVEGARPRSAASAASAGSTRGAALPSGERARSEGAPGAAAPDAVAPDAVAPDAAAPDAAPRDALPSAITRPVARPPAVRRPSAKPNAATRPAPKASTATRPAPKASASHRTDSMPQPGAERPAEPAPPTRPDWLALGRGALAEGRWAAARSAFERIPSRSPDFFDALVGLTEVAYEQQRREEALLLVEQALRLDPRSVTAHAWHGKVLYRLGRRAEGCQSWLRASRLDRGARSARRLYDRLCSLE